ncbi:MAG: acylneuraminate cytidylyltransferase family protein [bacterium]|nr:acylneuraminate cytidylyltransferase family protein [bacterium]
MKPKIIALVPMRHNSERVPQKNFRDFNGKPLFHWILATLSQCSSIDAIYVDTDSPVVKEKAPQVSKKITIIDRPANLCAGETPMNEILLHDVSIVEADYYLQTHVTNPLLRAETIERAIKTFFSSGEYDSLFGVTRLQTRLWNERGEPVNHNTEILLRTQDLPPIFEENSNIYIFTKENLRARKNRIGARALMFEIPRHEAWDIDEEIDFRIAEFLASQKL